MIAIGLRSGWWIALACAACRPPAVTDTSAASDDSRKPAADHPTVDVDLSPSGIGATIRGPEGAKAAAHEDYVTVDAEPDFHMEVHRGTVDPLAEKAEVVKRWGSGFRRFVRDDDKVLIYETEVAGDDRFHFLTWGEVEGLSYHCRSEKRGAKTLDAVRHMIDGCHAITANERVTGKP